MLAGMLLPAKAALAACFAAVATTMAGLSGFSQYDRHASEICGPIVQLLRSAFLGGLSLPCSRKITLRGDMASAL
jgi:hypothetical protein